MSDLVSIDGEIQRWATEYDVLSNDYHDVYLDAVRKQDALDLAKAKAMLNAPPEYKVDEKKAYVTITCQREATESHLAEATRDWHKERLKALSGLLTAAQSRANIVRDDLRLTNVRY